MLTELLASLDSAAGIAVLAALAFGDTLIGSSFFVFGEVAFLAAGAAITTNGTLVPAVVVVAAAWMGDLASYLIGRRYGRRISARFLTRLKRRKAWRRAKQELASRGTLFVVVARFLGPVAWVTPFLAGTLGMPIHRFLLASAVGVVLGVGQFLILGAIGVSVLERFLPFVLDHLAVVALLVCMLVSGVLVWRRSDRSYWVRGLQAIAMAATVFLTSNMLYFFVLNSHAVPIAPRLVFNTVCEAASGPFVVDPGETDLHLSQPVNIILLSETSGAELMDRLGWYRNVTFTHDEIGFAKYVSLLLQGVPPVSELYLSGVPADSAHQLPGTLKVREHIRWWEMGAGVHFGALSKTEEIAIKYYNHLPVLLHDIDPKVDTSRALFANQVATVPGYQVVGLASLTAPISDGIVADYETDGQVLIIVESGYALPRNTLNCLNIDFAE